MKVCNVELVKKGSTCELRADIHRDHTQNVFHLWYRFPAVLEDHVSVESGNLFLAALLLPAMKSGEELHIPMPVSPRLLRSADTIQDIYHTWNNQLAKIKVASPLAVDQDPQAAKGSENGMFFSSGVDSFYTLFKNLSCQPENEDTIKHLLVVHGFDIFTWNTSLYDQLLANCERVGSATGANVHPIATNIRDLMEEYVHWGYFGHGACLASVGLALGPLFKQIYIASSYTYADLFPWGSHPLLDPLWSTENSSFIHDGCEATRAEKTRIIADFPLAMENLRVCFNVTSGAINCGRCGKCVKTMLRLYIAGALDKIETLPNAIDISTVETLTVKGDHDAKILTAIADMLGNSGQDEVIKRALQKALSCEVHQISRTDELSEVWTRNLISTNRELESIFTDNAGALILVDEDQIRTALNIGVPIFPFVEQNGAYWGMPEDDAAAIGELERLIQIGATHIAFTWDSFWCLDHYTGFLHHLRVNYRIILESESLVIFDLRTS